jgi:hypothetical protein
MEVGRLKTTILLLFLLFCRRMPDIVKFNLFATKYSAHAFEKSYFSFSFENPLKQFSTVSMEGNLLEGRVLCIFSMKIS